MSVRIVENHCCPSCLSAMLHFSGFWVTNAPAFQRVEPFVIALNLSSFYNIKFDRTNSCSETF